MPIGAADFLKKVALVRTCTDAVKGGTLRRKQMSKKNVILRLVKFPFSLV